MGCFQERRRHLEDEYTARKKPIEAVTSTSKSQPQLQVSQNAAKVAMGELNRDLQKLHRKKTAPVTSTPLSDDLDDTEIDLFQNRDESEYQGTEQLCWVVTVNKKIKMDEQNFENSLLQGVSPENSCSA
ncbi:hypothetical protein HF521_009585 [Silurus meridionalis]|uniref:Uncharacterized protein n=1 Tax=Silurus meridionalis TaxID=175797 RepID=A0A8T0BWA3_SILME|nr:hypothetical protein HF521_009585 [Silurus meridionalis]